MLRPSPASKANSSFRWKRLIRPPFEASRSSARCSIRPDGRLISSDRALGRAPEVVITLRVMSPGQGKRDEYRIRHDSSAGEPRPTWKWQSRSEVPPASLAKLMPRAFRLGGTNRYPCAANQRLAGCRAKPPPPQRRGPASSAPPGRAREALAAHGLVWVAGPQTTWGWHLYPHVAILDDLLNFLDNRDIHRLMNWMPPQHGKSQLTSINFPVWYLGTHPEDRFLHASYEAEFAKKWFVDQQEINLMNLQKKYST